MRTAPREGGAEVGYVDIDWPIERNRFRHPPQLDPWHPIGEIAHVVVVAVLARRQHLTRCRAALVAEFALGRGATC